MKSLRRSSFPAVVVALSIALATPSLATGQNASAGGAQTGRMVITAQTKGGDASRELRQQDVSVSVDGRPSQITQWTALRGPNAGLQLVFLLDESAPASLSLQFPSIKKFVRSLPPTAEVGIAYMLNGRAVMVQTLTSDHEAAAKALRLPNSLPGVTGSPYFTLSDLAKKWPSQAKTRRVVFMVTNGEDPYYGSRDLQDPYVQQAITDAQKANLVVFSLYFRDTGSRGFGSFGTLFGQSYLLMVSNGTGGEAYTEAMSTPVSFDPFLNQLRTALNNQYMATITSNKAGLQRVKVKAKGIKVRAPERVNFGS